ncbi:MAG: hypothetical protein J6A01_10160 [Proteobacteria bacterium]|nr:hypothetical protein [Pseudomonadota bacterium]
MRIRKTALEGMLLVLLGASNAYAQNCNNLDQNAVWKQLFQEYADHYQSGEYAKALKTTDKLQEICKDSPVLNYAISRTYRQLDDHINEVKYIQRATDNAAKFNVNEETLKTFWFARYEAENPEASASARENSQQILEELNAALEASRQLVVANEKKEIELQYKEENIYKSLMWSGVAIGATGIAMTAAGGALIGIVGEKTVEQERNFKTQQEQVRVDFRYQLGLGLLCAGVSAAVAGAIAAGFGGYLYKRGKQSEETISFVPQPTGASLFITF